MPSKTTTTTKDVNAPRKPLTAYLLFSAVERPKLKASGLDNFAEMSKALGAAWKQADTKTKAQYEKEHEEEKIRYENELKEYEKTGAPAPSSKSVQKVQPPSKSNTKAVKPTAKKTVPVEKIAKQPSDEEESEEEEEEEEEKPAPPVKSSRKKN